AYVFQRTLPERSLGFCRLGSELQAASAPARRFHVVIDTTGRYFLRLASSRAPILQPSFGFKSYFQSRQHIPRRIGLNDRKEPALVLNSCGNAEVMMEPIICRSTNIRKRPTIRNELLTDLLVPEIDLHFAPRI